MSGLLPLEEALATVLENARQLSTERVFLQEALGRVLAEDIPSDTDKPLFDNSAMDGFAVRFEDISGKERVRLRLVGEVAAGQDSFPKVEKGCAVRIFTGAPVPQGADTVVPVEYTHTEGEWVVIEGEFKRGANIRRRGEDVRAGDIVLRKGKEIRGYEIGMLAFVNRSTLRVFRKPRVGILSTGDELLEVGEERTSPSQIRSSNHHMLYALTSEAGGQPHQLGIVRDDPQELLSALKKCHEYDVMITTGGVSMGEKDYVQYLVEKVGVRVLFHKLLIKPAKPVLFGTFGEGGLFFSLPGNPVSCAVAFDLLVYPALRTMLGCKEVFKRKVEARLTEAFRRKDPRRREFARAWVWFEKGEFLCKPYPKQGSHILTSLTESNAYLVVKEGVSEIPEGERAEVVLL